MLWILRISSPFPVHLALALQGTLIWSHYMTVLHVATLWGLCYLGGYWVRRMKTSFNKIRSVEQRDLCQPLALSPVPGVQTLGDIRFKLVTWSQRLRWVPLCFGARFTAFVVSSSGMVAQGYRLAILVSSRMYLLSQKAAPPQKSI